MELGRNRGERKQGKKGRGSTESKQLMGQASWEVGVILVFTQSTFVTSCVDCVCICVFVASLCAYQHASHASSVP